MTSITILERLLTPWCSYEPDPDAPVPPGDYADGPVPVPMTAVIRPDWGSPSHIRAVMTALDRVNPFYAAMCRQRQSDTHQSYEAWLGADLDRLREDIQRGTLVEQSAVVF